MNLSCSLKIGNITFNLKCPTKYWLSFIRNNYKPFLIKNTVKCDVEITVETLVKLSSHQKTLTVERINKTWQIKRYDFISFSPDNLKTTLLQVEKNKYAFDSWLRVFFTLCGVKKSAILVHGAGYSVTNGTYIFPGRSGKGKSTLIRILGKSSALTDELVCVYKKGSTFYASSTPFWGELKKGTGIIYDQKLKNILFLEHGKNISLIRIAKGEAVRSILRTILFFLKDRTRVNSLFKLAHDLILSVPASTLSFKKDSAGKDILDVISHKKRLS